MPSSSHISPLFETLIQTSHLPASLQPGMLEEACWMVEDGDQAGRDWCEEKGYPGYTSYASLNDLPHRAPAFSDLIKVLDKSAEDFARAVCWQLGSGRLVCDSLWINILGEGGNHSGHIHPNSIISGTCYITMPEGAGAIRFEDPRLGLMMAAPPLSPGAPARRQRFQYMTPKAGDVLMWESWLRHEVMTNTSEEARISISFNYSLTG
ncbi:MAG: TIGR02466 family protein [Henriciella sp.]|jgi:uncharacterized protein (TIGR02466 family)